MSETLQGVCERFVAHKATFSELKAAVKENKMKAWYVEVCSYWSGAQSFWFGPYETKAEAEADLSPTSGPVRADLGHRPNDVKHQVRAWVETATQAKSNGMRPGKAIFPGFLRDGIPGTTSEVNEILAEALED